MRLKLSDKEALITDQENRYRDVLNQISLGDKKVSLLANSCEKLTDKLISMEKRIETNQNENQKRIGQVRNQFLPTPTNMQAQIL